MRSFESHVLNRMGYGARINNQFNDIENFRALGNNDDDRLSAYLEQQLDWSSFNDSSFDNLLANANYSTINRSKINMWNTHHVQGSDRDGPAEELERLMVARGVHSEHQLLEVMADFWHNHFNVYSRDYYAQSTLMSWDRDVIRPPVPGFGREFEFRHAHAFGNFRQLLELSSRHAAMQHYLDNYINREGSPNENYARELMELHTLGAENYVSLGDPDNIPTTQIPLPWGPNGTDILVPIADQYVDEDVYAAMRMLTGWKIKDSSNSASSNFEDTGEFFFYEDWHDKFEKTILANEWSNFAPNPADIGEFLDILAYHPGTARHIARKLCIRFISDNPPQSVVDEVTNAWIGNRYRGDQLQYVYRALFLSDAFKDAANYGAKMKRPLEAIISSMRVCNSSFFPQMDSSDSWRMCVYYPNLAGQKGFNRVTPDGYPDVTNHWQGGSVLISVMRAFDWMVDENLGNADEVMPILAETLNAPANELPDHSPDNLTTFWLNRILGYEPVGGWLGTSVHTKLRDYLRDNPNDPSEWPADVPLTDISSNSFPNYFYERLRGFIKVLLSTREFLYR